MAKVAARLNGTEEDGDFETARVLTSGDIGFLMFACRSVIRRVSNGGEPTEGEAALAVKCKEILGMFEGQAPW